MDGLEDRVRVLEKRVRLWRALTIVLLATGFLFLGWSTYRVWTVTEKWNDAMPPIARGSRFISVIDSDGRTHAVWSGSVDGWTIKSRLATDTETRTNGCTLDFRIVGGSPRLSLTDESGREVWHAP